MDVPLDEVIHVEAIASSSTGAATDADSTPTFAVYEESTDTDIGIGGNMTKRTSLTGDYRASFTASAANGFELGKWYAVIGSATIGGVATKGVLMRFRIVAAESVAGYPAVDTTKWLGGTIPAVNTAGVPKVDLVLWLGVVPLALTSQQVQAVVPNTQKVDVETIKTRAITAAGSIVVGGFVGQDTAAVGVNASGHVSRVVLVDTLTTYTGNTVQTGDSFAIVNSGTFGNSALNTDLDALLARLTSARAGYLDNINNSTLPGASFPTDPADQSLVIAATDAIISALSAKATQASVDDLPTNAELATALGTADDAVLAQVALVKAKTDLIPPSPAAVGSAMTLADGAITDAKITLPTEATGTPSTFLQLVMWIAGMLGWRKVIKDSSAGTIVQYMSDGGTVKTTSTFTTVSTTDTLNKAS